MRLLCDEQAKQMILNLCCVAMNSSRPENFIQDLTAVNQTIASIEMLPPEKPVKDKGTEDNTTEP